MEGVPYRAEIEQNLVKSNTDSTDMTQEERWNIRYNEVKAFIETNHRNPIPEQARLPVAFHGIGLKSMICLTGLSSKEN